MIQGLISFVKSYWPTLTALGGWIFTAFQWYRDHKKQKLDHEKLKLEVRKLIGEQLEQLHGYDLAHRKADKHFAECNREFLKLFLDENVDCATLGEARDAICKALVDLIHRYSIYFGFFCHVYQDEPTRLESHIDNTIRDIGIWRRTQENINHENVLCRFNKRPVLLRISKQTLDPFRHNVMSLHISDGPKDLMNAELNHLLNVGHGFTYLPASQKDAEA